MSTISNTVAIPADDPRRNLVVANPDNSNAQHLGVVGDTYTILLSGMDTAGRFTLIDMHVPPGGGPPPHRHDFEETFIVLDGELQATFQVGPIQGEVWGLRVDRCSPTCPRGAN